MVEEEETKHKISKSKNGKQKVDIEDEEVKAEVRFQGKIPHTRNKLRLNFKLRMNPKFKETIIILDEEEKIDESSKSRKRQKKIEYANKNEGKTLKAYKSPKKLTRRMTRSQNKRAILAQVGEDRKMIS